MKDSQAVRTQSELYAVMSETIRECVRIIEDAKSQLDAIDQRAHEEIQKIIDSKGGWFGPLAMLSLIWAIHHSCRNEAAVSSSVAAAGNCARQAVRIQAATEPRRASFRVPPEQAQSLEASTRVGPVLQAGSREASDWRRFWRQTMAPPPRRLRRTGPRRSAERRSSDATSKCTDAKSEPKDPRRIRTKSMDPPGSSQRDAYLSSRLLRSLIEASLICPPHNRLQVGGAAHHAADQPRLRNVWQAACG